MKQFLHKGMIEYSKAYLGGVKTNWHGRKLTEKLVILESDDWGAIRTPSVEAVNAFQQKGFRLADSNYKYDALATGEDLDDLFNLLLKYRGSDAKPVKITANTIVANPDFPKIKAADYRTYFYEPFTSTLKRYPEHGESWEKWQQGIAEGVFFPQFHGREHLNITRWLKALQEGDERVRYSFDLESTYSGEGDYSFMEAYDWDSSQEVLLHQEIVKDGLDRFEQIFGYRSESFIAPCYNWDTELEQSLSKYGVRCLQGLIYQHQPTGKFGRYELIRHPFGSFNRHSQYYNVRNCFFEPSSNRNVDWVDRTMARVKAAFDLGKPAVISTHRVNYIGYINAANKSFGLQQLDNLLKKVTARWPELRFISTDQLSDYIT